MPNVISVQRALLRKIGIEKPPWSRKNLCQTLKHSRMLKCGHGKKTERKFMLASLK